MKNNIRKFALLIINDFDEVLTRIPLDYVDTPRNLGFELEFTTLESRLTTYFTSAREKKIASTLNLNFIPPNAYAKANAFKQVVQANLNKKMVLEYNDTNEIKYWEGKIQKFGQEELNEFKTLVCPISFLPATPKYKLKNNVITIMQSTKGKTYPYKYPYVYGKSNIENNLLINNYFDDIPLRVNIYGAMTNPQISLQDVETQEIYSTVRFKKQLAEGEELIVDAIQSKILLKRGNVYTSVYNYLDKDESLDSFLFAKANTSSKILVSLNTGETGYLKASYRQYTL